LVTRLYIITCPENQAGSSARLPLLGPHRRPHMTRNAYQVIKHFAATAGGRLEFVEHRPEPWAVPMSCFQNVRHKVSRDGGTGLSGWHFLMRHSREHRDYLVATHHSIW